MKNRINKNNHSDINEFIINAFDKRAIVRGDGTISIMDKWTTEIDVMSKWCLSENAAIKAVEKVLLANYRDRLGLQAKADISVDQSEVKL